RDHSAAFGLRGLRDELVACVHLVTVFGARKCLPARRGRRAGAFIEISGVERGLQRAAFGGAAFSGVVLEKRWAEVAGFDLPRHVEIVVRKDLAAAGDAGG